MPEKVEKYFLKPESESQALPDIDLDRGHFLSLDDLRPRSKKKRRLRSLLPGKRKPAIVFDPGKCTGCNTCEMVCSSRNDSLISPASARIKVIQDEEGGKVFAIFCQHCRQPVCVEVCPTRAIEKGEDGVVRIDETLCVHCGLCTLACPEAAPLISSNNNKVQKCDLCEGAPLCVEHCPEKALSFTKGKTFGWIRLLRWPVQIASFLLLVIILVGSFCSFTAAGLKLSCPLGVLQNIASSKTLIIMSIASAFVLIVLTVFAGRIFCGWICPFGFILDLVGKLFPKKLALPAFLRARMTKYGVLAASVGGSYALGFQTFCTVCPIGTLCRSHGVQGFFRGYELAILPAVAGLEIGERRGWCRYFCPVGALLALVAKLGLIKICIGAQKCKKFSCMRCADICPTGIIDRNQLIEGVSPKLPMDECILCMRCVDQCPYSAAKIRFRWQRAVPEET
jgi:ferredoxin-type protein NapH